jgi:uncharacterized protein (DUF362 family)
MLVSVVKTTEENIESMVQKAFDLVNGAESISNKNVVAIKPNLCRPRSASSGTTTDPRIVEALIRKIKSINECRINIVESDNHEANADETFDRLGYRELSDKYENVRCVNLSKDRKIRVHINGTVLASLVVPESLVYCDCLISVAKLKTHADYKYTGILKNQYGLLLSKTRRWKYHGFISKVIVDVNRFYKPDLSVIDGLVGMEGFGPIDGTPKSVGAVIMSKDPVAADTVAAGLIGIKPSSISYLSYAEKMGLGTSADLQIVGSDLKDLAVEFRFPSRYYWLSQAALALERNSIYVANFAGFVRLTRSALSTIGFNELQRRLSYRAMLRLAIDSITTLEG